MIVHLDKDSKNESGVKVSNSTARKVQNVLLKKSSKNLKRNLDFLKSLSKIIVEK